MMFSLASFFTYCIKRTATQTPTLTYTESHAYVSKKEWDNEHTKIVHSSWLTILIASTGGTTSSLLRREHADAARAGQSKNGFS